MFTLPALPFANDALAPVISPETLSYHYGKHHAAYVKTTNDLLAASGASIETLEAVIAHASQTGAGKLFNASAQAWNHAFYWDSMSPKSVAPEGVLADAIASAFGDLAGLKAAFVAEGVGHFASGWAWLVASSDGALKVISTHDAACPLTDPGVTPLLVCDVWEHAYYIDHRNDRKAYLEAWFDRLANWGLASSQLAAATSGVGAWRYPA